LDINKLYGLNIDEFLNLPSEFITELFEIADKYKKEKIESLDELKEDLD